MWPRGLEDSSNLQSGDCFSYEKGTGVVPWGGAGEGDWSREFEEGVEGG